MRRARVWTLLCLAALVGVAGPASARTQITFWLHPAYGSGKRLEAHENLVTRFEQENPDVDVELIVMNTQPPTLLPAVAGGAGPDVAYLAYYDAVPYARDGILASLEPYFDKLGGLAALREALFPVGFDASLYRGAFYAVPHTSSPHAYFYNADILARSGLTPPAEGWTWSDLEEIARKAHRVASSGEVETWGLSTVHHGLNVEFFYYQKGGTFYNEDFTAVLWNNEAGREAFEFYTRLVKEAAVALWPSTSGTQTFLDGNSALHFDGSYRVPAAMEQPFEAGVAPPLSADVAANFSGGWSIGVLADSDARDAAVRLAEFYARPENQAYYSMMVGDFPVSQDAIVPLLDLIGDQPLMAAFAQHAPYARRISANHPSFFQVAYPGLLNAYLLRVLNDELGVGPALELYEAEAAVVLAENPYVK